MKYLKALMMLAATFLMATMGIFFIEAAQAARGAQALVTDAQALVKESQRRVVDTSQNLNAILIQVGLVASRAERASRMQEQVSQKTLAILDHADDVLTQVAKSTQDVSGHTVLALDAIPPALEEVTKAAAALNKTASDPNIAQTLENIRKTSVNVAKTTDELAGTAADIHKKADQMLKPASLAKRAVTWALEALVGAKDLLLIMK